MHRVDRDFAEAIVREPGFIAYQAVRTGERTVASITLFREAEQAETSNELAAQWIAEELQDFKIESMGRFRWRGDGEPRDRRNSGAGASLTAFRAGGRAFGAR
jgi:hypothetical protein